MTKSASKMKTYLQMSLIFISSPPNPSLPGCPVGLDDIASYLTVILCSPHLCPPADRLSGFAYSSLTWSLESIISSPSTATVLFHRLIVSHLCSGTRVLLLLWGMGGTSPVAFQWPLTPIPLLLAPEPLSGGLLTE